MLTQKALKKILYYDPDTGAFMRKKKVANSAKVGVLVGSIDSCGYVVVCVNGRSYPAHRLAWFYTYNVWPEEHIDHINHIRDDNRIVNLRCVSIKENQRNKALNSNNTSGISGVAAGYKEGSWKASITVDRKLIPLGQFEDKFEAICARKSANNRYGFHPNHGDAK